MEFPGLLSVAIVILVVAGVALVVRLFRRETVQDYEVGLLIAKGVTKGDLKPGQYWIWSPTTEIKKFDTRAQMFAVAGQEMLTSDLLPVRLSVMVTFRIADPRLYRSESVSPESQFYGDVQVECRARVATKTLDELLADRNAIVDGMAEGLNETASQMGIEITSVSLRDVTLTGPAKLAYADLWKAQKEGLAALERARGEQAALRSLANSARMLKGNPELMNLRLLQALSGGPGKPAPTIVLGGQGILPVSEHVDPSADAPDNSDR